EEYADHRLKPKQQAQSGGRSRQARGRTKDHARNQAKENQARNQAKENQAKENQAKKNQAKKNQAKKNQAKDQAKKQVKNRATNQTKDKAKGLPRNLAGARGIAAPNDHATPVRTQVVKPPSRVQTRTRTRAI